jgi:hypothetical protein
VADIRVPFGPAQAAFGLPATVTVPGEASVDATVVWSAPVAIETPGGMEFQRTEMRRVLSLPIDDLPLVPNGTVIVAAERLGDVAATWRVDGTAYKDADHTRVFVVPASEET